MAFRDKVGWYPREEKKPEVVTTEVSGEGSPSRSLHKELRHRGQTDSGFLRFESGLRARLAAQPWNQPNQTDQTQNHEEEAPAKPRNHDSSNETTDRWPQLRTSIE